MGIIEFSANGGDPRWIPTEEVNVKRIGVLTSGGDAPGMNAAIRAIVRTALANSVEIVGVKRGYDGLITGDTVSMDGDSVANIVHLGGTILETARSAGFMTKEGRRKAIRTLAEKKIEGLILIGGDGTFRGGTELTRESGVSVVGVPGTIDNDVFGTDYTIGFDTAVNTALEAIDRIRDTALSHERLFFVEVMGNHTGFIAFESGIAGGAQELLIPEVPMSIDDLCSKLQEKFKQGRRSAIVVVAEVEKPGVSFQIAQQVRDRVDFESRVCVLGHIQRGGSPTARDRVLASKLGIAAVKALLEGRKGCMVGEVRSEVVYTGMEDTWGKKKELYAGFDELIKILFQ
ncbi:MAG: 6-phosphofructokinase [Dehalococcoidia bacterium]|nr:6-phosphofructokinase [Dehalococcoidia bacterium]